MKKISVYCEVNSDSKLLDDVSYELISKAYELTKQIQNKIQNQEEYIVEAIVLSDELKEESIKKSFSAGASRFVFIKDKCLSEFSQTIFAKCFEQYYKQNPTDTIIFPATHTGRMVAPRITTILNTGLVADCTDLEFILKNNELKFAPTRPTFGSELMATILSKQYPQCATVRPNTFKPVFGKTHKCEYVEFKPESFDENRIKLLRTIIDNSSKSGDFSNAQIVLACGYGISENKDKIYFSKIENIARVINAKIASTRKVVDLGLMPRETQIGQTGSTVEAQLYITFGISGAIQHIQGMKNSKVVVAINSDENADIFKYADYKIVGDAKKIIDELYSDLIK